ncbi:MAG TPA: tetratricopeptide repeat protein, partial [Pirellulales bacterium]|nr:tetratricopeptide repeat protein [Pirellulales bacterium]
TNRGRVWMVKGASARALDDARKALKLDARQAMAHVVIGAYWYEQENYDVARTEFDEALRIDPRLMLARFHRGRLYSRLGEYQKALIDLNLAVRLSPKDIASLQQRSYVYYRLGAMEKSNADRLAVRRAQRKTPSPPQTVAQPGASVAAIAAASPTSDEVGLLSNSSESMQPATAWLRAAGTTPSSMQSPPPQDPQPPAQNTKLTQATPLNNVAWRMATSTDERYLNGLRAVELATEACELTEWKRAAFVDTLAAAYAEAGDFEAAVRWQTKAIELSVEKTIRKAAEERLELYREHRPFRTR